MGRGSKDYIIFVFILSSLGSFFVGHQLNILETGIWKYKNVAAADTLCAFVERSSCYWPFETVVSAQSAGLGVHFHPVCLLATFQSVAFTRLNKISFLTFRCCCHYSIWTCIGNNARMAWHGHSGTTRTVDNTRRLHEQRPLDGTTMLHIPTHAFCVVYRSIYSWCWCWRCCCWCTITRSQCYSKQDLYFPIQDTNWLSLLCI